MLGIVLSLENFEARLKLLLGQAVLGNLAGYTNQEIHGFRIIHGMNLS